MAGDMTSDLFIPPCPDCGSAMLLSPDTEGGCGQLVADCGCGFGIVGDNEDMIRRACGVLRSWKSREARRG